MFQFVVGAVTVSLTVEVLLDEVELLETVLSASTPTMVKVYVFEGVIPLGVIVVGVVVFVHAGSNRNVPLTTKRASNPHAFRERFPPTAAPKPASASMGKGSQRA
jgi:hypothetical protein